MDEEREAGEVATYLRDVAERARLGDACLLRSDPFTLALPRRVRVSAERAGSVPESASVRFAMLCEWFKVYPLRHAINVVPSHCLEKRVHPTGE